MGVSLFGNALTRGQDESIVCVKPIHDMRELKEYAFGSLGSTSGRKFTNETRNCAFQRLPAPRIGERPYVLGVLSLEPDETGCCNRSDQEEKRCVEKGAEGE